MLFNEVSKNGFIVDGQTLRVLIVNPTNSVSSDQFAVNKLPVIVTVLSICRGKLVTAMIYSMNDNAVYNSSNF